MRRLSIFSLLLAGCSGADGIPRGGAPSTTVVGSSIGSSIAVLRSGQVAVVDVDSASVSILSPDTLDPTSTISVGDEPRALLELPSGHVLVAAHGSGELIEIDPASGHSVGKVAACAGAFGLAMSPDGKTVAASCEWEGRVLALDARTLSATELARDLVRPRPVAFLGTRVLVGEYTLGDVVELEGASRRHVTLVPPSAPYRPALTEMTAALVSALLVDGSRVLVTHQLVNNTGNTTAEPVSDDYGSVPEGNPKINPALTVLADQGHGLEATSDPVLYARFDGGPRVFSQPSAVAVIDDRTLLVTNLATSNVAVIDRAARAPDTRVIANYGVGAGPSGIAVEPGGKRAFVDDAYDGAVSRLDLTLGSGPTVPIHSAELTRARALPSPYSDAALAGRRLFHDASSPHLTASGVVSCGNCHPDGGDDGLVWFVHTKIIPLKRRRTPNLSSARSETAPFHWDGQFQTMSDLVQHTLTDLMAGDAKGVAVEGIQAYIDEIVRAPVLPVEDPSAVARGRAVFQFRQCAECHSGNRFTDDALHVVLSPMSLSPDDSIATTNTPDLHGVFVRAPYFHDGRSPSLEDSLLRKDAGLHGGPELRPDERADLVQYLRSL